MENERNQIQVSSFSLLRFYQILSFIFNFHQPFKIEQAEDDAQQQRREGSL